MESRQPETLAQEVYRDNLPEKHTWLPPPLDYIKGWSAMHGDDTIDIGGAGVDEVLLLSPKDNLHILNRAEA